MKKGLCPGFADGFRFKNKTAEHKGCVLLYAQRLSLEIAYNNMLFKNDLIDQQRKELVILEADNQGIFSKGFL